MLPDVPILQPPLYRSGFTDSHYNPHVLIARLVAGQFGDPEDPTFWQQAFEYNATVVHERMHWLQHHGTSFGAFLGALRLSQQMTTLGWFRSMPSDKVRALLSARADESRPILAFHPKRQYPIFDSLGDRNPLDVFRQIWFDHQWIHAMFEDSLICESSGKPPGAVVGEIIGDVMLALCGDGNFQCANGETIRTSQFEARRWFAVDDSSMVFAKMAGMRLTSRMIMEAAATIAEMQLLPTAAWPHISRSDVLKDAFAQRIKTVFESHYGIPIRSLLLVLDADVTKLPHILPTVSVLCFLALNPPLPPYVMSPPENSNAWKWHHIYPPLRFARLCHAVPHVGLLDSACEHDRVAEYIDKLVDACQLPTSLGIPYPHFSFRPGTPDFSNSSNTYPTTLQAPYHDYVFWVQSKLDSFRRNSLPFLVSFGDCLSGELACKHIRDLVVVDDTVPYAWCPLLWTDSEKIGFSCPTDFGHWLIRSIAVHHSLFDVVAGVGKYDLAAFPPEIQHSESFYTMVENSILPNLTQAENA